MKDRGWLAFAGAMVGMFLAAGLVFLLAERLILRFGLIAAIVLVTAVFLTWAWFHDRTAVEQGRQDYAE